MKQEPLLNSISLGFVFVMFFGNKKAFLTAHQVPESGYYPWEELLQTDMDLKIRS